LPKELAFGEKAEVSLNLRGLCVLTEAGKYRTRATLQEVGDVIGEGRSTLTWESQWVEFVVEAVTPAYRARLITAMKQGTPAMRKEALAEAVATGDNELIEAVWSVARGDKEQDDVRVAALDALSKAQGQRAFVSVMGLAGSAGSAIVRAKAFEALWLFTSEDEIKQTLPLLVKGLSEETPVVRLGASRALAVVPALWHKADDGRALDEVIRKRLALEENAEVRQNLAIGAGCDALEVLVVLAEKDQDPQVRIAGMLGVVYCDMENGYQRAEAVVKRLLDDKTPAVWEGKQTTVGDVAKEQAKLIQEMLKENPDLRGGTRK